MVVSMERWVGKVAVVTGASAGIGAAIVEQLVEHGAIVAGLARRKERIEEMAQKLSDKKGKVVAVKCDMTKEDDILAAFEYVKKNLGPVSILINNAGVIQNTWLIDGDTDKWRTLLDTNVLGLCIATREAVKDMKANKIAGHIIHMNSLAGHRVFDYPNMNLYPASKHAVTALAESLRFEINRQDLKIKITSISPGYTLTEIAETCFGDKTKDYPLQTGLTAEDIADAVIYSLSTPPHVNVTELTLRLQGDGRN